MAKTNTLLTTLVGTDIYQGGTYRVHYSGSSPRHQDAIWLFDKTRKATRDSAGNLVQSAGGPIVYHTNSSVLNKMQKLTGPAEPYLSSSFQGTIEEVVLGVCQGWGTDSCESGGGSWQGGNYVIDAATTIRTPAEVAANPIDRCVSCQGKQTRWETQQATVARADGIEKALEDAIARRAGEEDAGPVITVPAPVRVPEAVTVTAVDDGTHPLAHLIPHISAYDNYVSREVDGLADIEVLDYHFARQENILLEGPTESGKTGLLRAWCALRRRPLVTVPCNGALDPTSLFVLSNLEDGNVTRLRSNIIKAIEFGGVINFDEFNMAPAKVLAVTHELTDDRRQVTIPDLGYVTLQASPECFVVGSYNAGYAGTNDLNYATKRRFQLLPWGYDENVERTLIQRVPVLHDIKRAIRNIGPEGTGDVETPLGPGKLLHLEQHAIDLNVDYALRLFVGSYLAEEREAIEGIVEAHREALDRQVANAKATEVAA